MAYRSAQAVLQALVSAYYDERSVEGVLSCVTDDVEWVGTENQDSASGREALRALLQADVAAFPAPIGVKIDQPTVQTVGDSVALITVCGHQVGVPGVVCGFTVRGTICCVRTDSGWLVNNVHTSVPNAEMEKYTLERELEDNRRKERALMASIPGGVASYRLKKDGRLLPEYVSESLARISGYTVEEFLALQGENALENVPAEEREGLSAQILTGIASRAPFRARYHVITKNGSRLLVRMDAAVVQDAPLAEDDSALLYVVNTVVSEESRRAMQEQQHYRTVMEMLGIAYWEWSAEHGFYASENYQNYAVSRAPVDEVRANAVFEGVVHPEDVERLKEFFSKGDNHEERSEAILRMSMVDGTYRWTEVFGFKEYAADGSTRRMSCVLRDVDKEWLAQNEKLQEAVSDKTELMMERERLYTALFSLIPMVISCNLTRNRYNMMNYSNYTTRKASAEGSYDELIEIGLSTVPPEDRVAFQSTFGRENILQAYREGKKSVVLEHRQWGDDGVLRWIRTQAVFVTNQLTGDVYQITLARDISDQKQKELQLKDALDEARRAGNAKNEFLSRMSHDLRTPMNAIIGLSALTLDDAKNPAIVRDNMTKMRSASDFMLGLINDILDMAKIESGAVKLTMEPYSYREYLVNMKTMFKPQCDEKGIKFEMYEGGRNPVALTDKVRINQIFFNILSNAVKYTPQGGAITYTIENLKVEGMHAGGDCVITDNGIGMSEEFQKHLFEPFMQESDRVTPELQGSGLGLSITKQLVELMGGTISITSKKGQGTCVRVHLEFDLVALEAKPEAEEARHAADPEALRGKCILLAEDHPLNTQIAKALLEKRGMTVVHAENGKRAVEVFAASPVGSFDAVLMDIRMPVLSGLDAAAAIRALPRADARTVPILAMTANAYEDDARKSREVGMNAHLAKPIDPAKLYAALGEFIK